MERRLAAIMATDVVGYSRLMAEDESATLQALSQLRHQIFEPALARHHGRLVKLMGDGALIEFPSAVDAARCAVWIQKALARRKPPLPQLRIGLNLGDLAVDGDDIYGDGVNVAARLQALAEPGTIYISDKVHAEIANRSDLGASPLGEHQLKNIATPVPVWRLESDGAPAAPRPRRRRLWLPLAAAGALGVLLLGVSLDVTDEPSSATVAERGDLPAIAVLPFRNMSGDPEQRYFSDGITVDLITDLSRVSGLFVIAWSSSSGFRESDQPSDAAGALGADYVLDGSVRRQSNKVRINAELFDGETGRNVWAARFDRQITDVFAVQDDVVRQIVDALKVELTDDEASRLATARPIDPEVYDMMLRARADLTRFSPDGDRTARALLREVVRRDPANAHAWASIGMSLGQRAIRAWDDDPGSSIEEALALTERAVALDPELPWARLARSIVLMAAGRLEEAEASVRRAIELDPNYADAYAQLAAISGYRGLGQRGLDAVEQATRLNPVQPWQYVFTAGTSAFADGRFEEAARYLEQAIERNPEFISNHLFLAAAYAHLDRLDDAQWEVEEVLALNSDYTIDRVRRTAPFEHQEDLERLLSGLERAGLPEGG